jgi:LL-diaminopimelate aminotransferase
VGVILGNAEAVRLIGMLKSNVDSGPYIGIQDATITALTGDQEWLFERQETYKERRDLVVAGLRAAGCEVEVPQATIYVWARIPPAFKTASEWAEYLLEKKGVSLTPGTAFGEHFVGHCHQAHQRSRRAHRVVRLFGKRPTPIDS